MSSELPIGFLVVVAEPRDPRNPRYRGVNTVPAYPSDHAEEDAALDDYVFGKYKDDDSNLIPDYPRVLDLWQRLAPSPRRFETRFASPPSTRCNALAV